MISNISSPHAGWKKRRDVSARVAITVEPVRFVRHWDRDQGERSTYDRLFA